MYFENEKITGVNKMDLVTTIGLIAGTLTTDFFSSSGDQNLENAFYQRFIAGHVSSLFCRCSDVADLRNLRGTATGDHFKCGNIGNGNDHPHVQIYLQII